MEQHDYIVLLEKFFKKEASSEERRILIEWIRKPGIRNEFNLLCEQMWKEAAVEIDKTVEEEMWNHLQRNLDEPKILSPKKRRWQPIIYKVAATSSFNGSFSSVSPFRNSFSLMTVSNVF